MSRKRDRARRNQQGFKISKSKESVKASETRSCIVDDGWLSERWREGRREEQEEGRRGRKAGGGERSGVLLWLTAELTKLTSVADYSKTPNHDYLLTF